MPKKILTQPLYLLLLPVFFVLHAVKENPGLINTGTAVYVTLYYCSIILIIYLLSYLLIKNKVKRGLLLLTWAGFYFFFGAVHEFLKDYSPVTFFSRYIFLIPFFVIVLIAISITIKRSNRKFPPFIQLLNLVLVLYILLDITTITWQSFNPAKNRFTLYQPPPVNNPASCNNCSKPDIYFLLFDEYASSPALKTAYDFTNDLDSFLSNKKFRVLPRSRANYNFTAFSMSSILNMSYIEGLQDTNAVTIKDYTSCNSLIKNNLVMQLLQNQGYKIVNYSLFDFPGNPSPVDQYFIPLGKKLITHRTFFNHLDDDIGWWLVKKIPFLFSAPDKEYLSHLKNNTRFLDLVHKASRQKDTIPRFIYAHFLMPHAPFFFDKNGNRRSDDSTLVKSDMYSPASYVQYISYVNSKIKELVNTLLKNNPGAVVMIMGDHGFREFGSSYKQAPVHQFQNMNAIYYPDHSYNGLYDSITGVNQFRVVFNKLFQQSMPLLKDSCIFLSYKR